MLYYLDVNFAILVFWVPERFFRGEAAIVIVRHDLKQDPLAPAEYYSGRLVLNLTSKDLKVTMTPQEPD